MFKFMIMLLYAEGERCLLIKLFGYLIKHYFDRETFRFQEKILLIFFNESKVFELRYIGVLFYTKSIDTSILKRILLVCIETKFLQSHKVMFTSCTLSNPEWLF